MCETTQIGRKSLSSHPHDQDPLLLWVSEEEPGGGNLLVLGPTYRGVRWGYPYLQLYLRVRDLVVDPWIVHRVVWTPVWLQLDVELLLAGWGIVAEQRHSEGSSSLDEEKGEHFQQDSMFSKPVKGK